MREIKFRHPVFDVHGNFVRFHYWGYGVGPGNFRGPALFGEENVSQQYTGLKDKNGREIYEGDIVKCSLGCPHKIEFTMIPNHNFGGMPGFYLSGLNAGYSWLEQEEVVGNIYETPELLGE